MTATTSTAAHSLAAYPAVPAAQGWTVAYRRRSANRFIRVAGISVSWDNARRLTAEFDTHQLAQGDILDIYYVPTQEAETTPGGMAAGELVAEDRANILTESGKRVRMIEGELPAGLVYAAPQPAETIAVLDTHTASCLGLVGDAILRTSNGPMTEAALDAETAMWLATMPNACSCR